MQVLIPTLSGESIGIPLHDLPYVDQLVDILKEEKCSVSKWIECAVAYFSQGKYDEVELCLLDGLNSLPQGEKHILERARYRNCLASFHTLRSQMEGRNKENDLKKAEAELDYTKRELPNFPATLVNRALLELARDKKEEAMKHFRSAIHHGKKSDDFGTPLMALVGKARLHYEKGEHERALQLYKEALIEYPGCPAMVRVSLGLTCHRLGHREAASMSFRRALELEASNTTALLALSVIEFEDLAEIQKAGAASAAGVDKRAALLSSAMNRVDAAYRLNPSEPYALVQLANHLFERKKDGETCKQVETLAQLAIKATSATSRLRAEANYLIGRCAHALGKFTRAEKYYKEALRSWPSFPLAKFAKAQVNLATSTMKDRKNRTDFTLTITELRKLKEDPATRGDKDTIMLLGTSLADKARAKAKQQRKNRRTHPLKLETGIVDEALGCLERVTSIDPLYTNAWVQQALLRQMRPRRSDREAALKAYEKAAWSLRVKNRGSATPEPLPMQLHANVGVLRYLLSRHEDSLHAIQSAQRVIEKSSPQEAADANLSVTLAYNAARVKEAMGNVDAAKADYDKIAKDHADYVDAKLRLGCIAQKEGRSADAESHFKEVLAKDKKQPDAWLLLGNLKFAKGEFMPAKSRYESVTKAEGLKHDTYSRLSMGNASFSLAQGKSLSSSTEKYLREAKGLFRDVLTAEGKNVVAANGLGMVLAEEGNFAAAKEVFELVRSIGDDVNLPGPWINLGHVLMAEKKFGEAASVYGACLEKFFPTGDRELELCLAHAHMKSSHYADCSAVLRRAITLAPSDLRMWFNLALSEEARSLDVLNSTASRGVEDVESAIASLQSAKDIFEWLGCMGAVQGRAGGAVAEFRPSTPPGSPVARASKSLLELAAKHDRERANQEDWVVSAEKGQRDMSKRTSGHSFKSRLKAREHRNYIKQLLPQAEDHLQRTRILEEKKRNEEAKKNKLLEEALAAKEEAKRFRAAAQKKKEDAIIKRAKDEEKRMQELREQYAQESKAREAGKAKSRRSRKSAPATEQLMLSDSDDSDSASSDESDGVGASAAFVPPGQGPSYVSMTSGDGDTEQTGKKRRRLLKKGSESDGDDDDDDEKAGNKETGTRQPSKKRMKLIDSDDSDDE